MRYPFTTFSLMFLIIVSVIVFGGFTPQSPLTDTSNALAEKSHVNPSVIKLEDNITEIHTKTDVEVSEPEDLYPNWRKVTYGGKIYYVDDKGFYHDNEGRVWKPMTVDTTAYTWLDDGVNRRTGAGDGKTSISKNARTTYGIAHPNGCGIVRYGQTFHISGYGIFKVDDACGESRKQWRKYRRIRLDIRIPNRRYDGVWRTNNTIRRIALRHGLRKNRMVLLLIKST